MPLETPRIADAASESFSSLLLSPELLEVVADLGFEKLTPIQKQSIPLLLENKDVIGQAKTGSGKTAAFALPILQKIDLNRREIQAMVLCPTRELGDQVARDLRKLARKLPGLQVLVLCGGQPMRAQVEAMEKGVHIVVGTPGRVVDHIQRRNIDLFRIKTLVLDEADVMLDMGFEEQMAIILDETPRTRQTVFFSATFPEAIRQMSQAHQVDPITVKVKDEAGGQSTIRQLGYVVQPDDKVDRVIKLFQEFQPESALIFCRMKVSTTELCAKLSALGLNVAALNGDLEQKDRDKVMAMFRNQSLRVLVATDVAARGLDVAGLSMVINFDLPGDSDTYVHRIGRTGRAGNAGLAVSLVDYAWQTRLVEYGALTGVKVEMNPLPPQGSQSRAKFTSSRMRTLYIAGGRKEKMRPGDILGALTGEGIALAGSEIGKIEIHDHFAYVAVMREKAEVALSQLRLGRIKGKRFIVSLVE